MRNQTDVDVHDFTHGRRRTRDLSLSTQLAVISLLRVLRPLVHRSRRFVATIVVPEDANVHDYAVAAHWIMENPRADGIPMKVHYDILALTDREDFRTSVKLSRTSEIRRAIVLMESKATLNADARLASDLVAILPPTSGEDIKIAALRMGFGRISDEDAEFLSGHSLASLTMAMRAGRPIGNAIARLKAHLTDTKEEQPLAVVLPFPDKPTLHDLPAYGDAKTWGLELAADIADWKAGKLSWADIDHGILLSGPPGTGKTSFATALANTCGMTLVAASAARWQAKGHLGDFLKAMRSAFDKAKASSPSILFIDEFDSFSAREEYSGDSASYSRQVVNGLLECLDGIDGRDGVVVVGATNFPDLVDPALLRPGRLDRQCVIPLPDAAGRRDIFRYHLGKDLRSRNIDIAVKNSRGWTGADIQRATRDAKRAARRAGREMEMDDLLSAMPERVKLPPEVIESVAIHELGHALVSLHYESDPLMYVTIEDTVSPNAKLATLGGAHFKEPPIRRKTSTYFENRIAMLLAGMAAERLVYGDHSIGSAGDQKADLNIATDLATMMEVTWGLGRWMVSESISTPEALAAVRGRRPELGDIVESTLRKQFERATAILETRRDLLRALAKSLVEKKTLSAEEIAAAVENHEREIGRGEPTLIVSSS
ncbi:AAA family ATPase [Shinella kummerowiae]|uniref:AAA family ATPase n=1 Tax=Shinella kummerowiae TaxID=417745 RepID=A0A6N8S6Y9_9HYPH|nr:AAA family ATPase [Shinella kummerowiae]MXN44157.1 AAA family ATPase [Shinella kummerowiae]